MTLTVLCKRMAADDVEPSAVADFLDISDRGFDRKLAEALPFMRDEMFALRDRFFPDESIDRLFQSDGDVPTHLEKMNARIDVMEDSMLQQKGYLDGEDVEIIRGLREQAQKMTEQEFSRMVGM